MRRILTILAATALAAPLLAGTSAATPAATNNITIDRITAPGNTTTATVNVTYTCQNAKPIILASAQFSWGTPRGTLKTGITCDGASHTAKVQIKTQGNTIKRGVKTEVGAVLTPDVFADPLAEDRKSLAVS